MATVQYFDGSTWQDLDRAAWEVEQGVSSVKVAPTATIETLEDVIGPNDQVRVRDTDTATTIVEGYARSRGNVAAGGRREITVDGHGVALMAEPVTFAFASGSSDENLLLDALNNAERGGEFTLDFSPTPQDITSADGSLINITDEPLGQLFRRICDIRNYVYWIDVTKTIHVEEPAGRGTLGSYTVGSDPIQLQQFESGNVQTVRNRVTVRAKGSAKSIEATAESSGSIDAYGVRAEEVTSDWIASQADAQALADSLLAPLTEIAGTLVADPTLLGTQYETLVNYGVTLSDPNRDLDNTDVAITKQVITEGRDELTFGGGSTTAVEETNRRTASRDSEGVVSLDDVPDSANFEKIIADAVQDGVHLLDAAAGTLDDIQDGGTYARVREGNVDDDNFVLLATSIGDLDDIDDGSTYGRVLATGIDAGQIILSAAQGDLDDIEDGTNFGKVDITNLTPGGAVFATGVELDDGRDLDSITTEDIDKGSSTVIDGGEILTSSLTATEIAASTITADEIDTLMLETQELEIGTEATDWFRFDINGVTDEVELLPTTDGTCTLGSSGENVSSVFTNTLITPGGSIDSTGAFFTDVLPDTQTASPYDLGRTGNRWDTGYFDTVDTNNLIQNTPKPLTDKDPRVDREPSGKGSDVDLSALKNVTWGDPPEYAAQRETRDGYEPLDANDDGTRPVELGHMTNYLLETAKAQQEVIDNQAERIDDLEQRLDRLESGGGAGGPNA